MSHSAIIAAVERLLEDLSVSGAARGWPRGIIGAFSADGRPLYAYPEVAGHWLRWASSEPRVADETGLAVVRALEAMTDLGPWPTRVYVTGEATPVHYRNRAFLFDHCMLWSGLRRWSQARGCKRASALARRLSQVLKMFVDGDRLVPCWPVPDQAAVPHWSTHGGPFLIKACVRLLSGAGVLSQVCARQAELLSEAALREPHVQAHPQLYAIEGLYESGRRELACQAFTALLRTHGGGSSIREQPNAGPRRADVLAQLLRIGCLLRQVDRRDPVWISLAGELAGRVDDEGRIPFAETVDPRPTWAALFALQALQCWLDQPPAPGELV
jgi:hypothetical protein